MSKGLLGKVEKDNKKYTPIKRAPDVKYENLISKKDIITTTPKENNTLSKIDTKSIFVNIRINQGIRNTLNGLSILGYGDTALDTVSIILENFLATLTPYEIEKLESLEKFYDQKDMINYEKRKINKK